MNLENWLVQSSSVVGDDGARLSSSPLDGASWYAAKLPSATTS
jgi:hypothetical protein